ncbi:TonB-dependent receptor plug domain-containing protein [Flavobacterium hydatis]|uniref:TonB-dependent receptor n=1 Tax=Flavobacterium hydatis TaxID=991 RepID=A0A086AE76_FLAHY|nr:TonB-dependent receptor [Flavobacterium hydatis]KFF14990.1 TonB-dependent receptor [Flavobacterium hydatis]OXA94043.1 TonB-dependent receptor [Flavobacterium hydatis]
MTLQKFYIGFLLLACQFISAQNDSITKLKEVIVSDTNLKKYSDSQSVQVLNDSIINKNQASLTSLLNYNTVIYFKENGLGMTSAPSFRGTTGAQTAVIWNGININSQFLGQADFNTIGTRDFNSIAVKAGGGSVLYGSGAIGGSIHLNNDIRFKKGFSNHLFLSRGSYDTYSTNYRANVSSDKYSIQVNISRNSSENDFKYPGTTDQKNLNGAYYNTSMNTTFGYKIDSKNTLKLYSQFYDGERHFSLTSPNETKTKYNDFNTRNLLEWESLFNRFTSKLRVAHIGESYKYFPNITSDSFTYGKVETSIIKYDLAFDVNEKIKLNAIVDYNRNKGYGSSINNVKRQVGSASLLLQHFVTDKWDYTASIRQELTDNYGNPFLFSLGTRYEFTDFYRIKLNASKNFRMPTYNDLYWQGSGNPDLKPETSYQGEIGNEFFTKNFSLSVTTYYNSIKDLLRWIPSEGGGDTWSPENTAKVRAYGAEILLEWRTKIKNHNLTLNGTYAYTVSESKQLIKGELLYKQLIYVPYHKLTGSVSYNWKKVSSYFQYLYTGEAFSTPFNNPATKIKPYNVGNLGIDYDLGKKNSYKIGFQILNIWNENYQPVISRQMPGRNYTVYINLNF